MARPGAGRRRRVGAGSTTHQADQHTDQQQRSPRLLRRPVDRIDRRNPGLGPHERAPRLAPRSAQRRHRRRLQRRALTPPWFDTLDGVAEAVRNRVLWLGFRDLADAIRQVTSDATRLIGEQTRFLLTELVALYETDGLLTNDDTVVVAARAAWPEYQYTSAYVCQPDRSFRVGVVTHFGFYAEGAIQPLVPRIRKYLPSVPFTRVEADTRRAAGEQEVGDLIDRLLDDGPRTEGSLYGVLLLSGPDDPATVRLAHAVQNDTTTRATGRNWAWTIGQRYTRLDRLRSGAKVTSEL